MRRFSFILIALLGCSALAVSAAAAHKISDAYLAQLAGQGALYQLIHAVALLALAGKVGRTATASRLCWCAGIVLFCGSLYAKAFGLTEAAPLTPLGGTLLMAGWLFLCGLRKETA